MLRYRPHPYLNYTGSPDYVTPDGVRLHHAIGIRATDVDLRSRRPRSLRIVALGGSTTFGLYAPDAGKTWPGLLQTGLRSLLEADVEVINAGIPNYSTYELLGFAALWLPELRPDIVLVHTGLNDAFTVGFPDEGGPDNGTFRHAWSYRPMPALARRAMRASFLARALGTGWLSRSGHQIGDMTPAIQFPVPPDDEVRHHAERATGRYFRRNLETLIVLIRHAGAEPVLVDMPLNPTTGPDEHVYYGPVTRAVVRNNRIMAEVGERSGVRVVELYDRMRDPELFLDAAHVGPLGMIEKAQAVLDAVAPLARRALESAVVSEDRTQNRPDGTGVEADELQR